ncbi:helicase-related protein [Lysinibacillus sp. FSL R7-0073]|uniref:helicase-related protein n=1 Tax=Lysinibacillus sp. FSL R7-0073 TaxID=2921669 RepID=UPI0030FCD935
MDILQGNIGNRDILVEALKQELIGPVKIDEETMIGINVDYESIKDIYYSSAKDKQKKFYYNIQTKDEIIHNGNSPITQYSAGILLPYNQELVDLDDSDSDSPLNALKNDEVLVNEEDIEKIANRSNRKDTIEDNSYSMSDEIPSSMAFTFYVSAKEQLSQLSFEITGGIYKKVNVRLIDEENKYNPYQTVWWNREAVNVITDLQLHSSKLMYSQQFKHDTLLLDLRVNLRQIESIEKEGYFVTVSLTNLSNERSQIYKNALFQCCLKVTYKNNDCFDPYPTSLMLSSKSSEEDLSNSLLYHDVKTYALGHGCSVNWDDKASFLKTTFIPEHEITNITPDIKVENDQELKISMLDMVDGSLQDVQQMLSKITSSYEKWIGTQRCKIANYPINLHVIAEKHLEECEFALNRMKKGILALEDESILKAFQYANLAMFIQQISGGSIQQAIIEEGNLFYKLDDETILKLPAVEELRNKYVNNRKGYWRAFQISFLLMSLPSLPKEATKEREIADLIWFPTGGGKTEAYLAVAATTILYRRLVNADDCGTEVLMRYTLRLLTADQFQRSARLICALDLIRMNHTELFGKKEISIGLWVGKSNTPNKIKDAIEQLKNLKTTGYKKYEFLINHCPLCRCEMTRYEKKAKVKGNKEYEVTGYRSISNRRTSDFFIYCPNKDCSFHQKLPIYLVDEQIYENSPTFIIGTVDKFAMLAWEPKARSIFGIGKNGDRYLAPPSLIIQDELHLISGPLGSTVGIYETIIEELCTDYRTTDKGRPKIICATATVRGYKKQIQALFDRETDKIKLFPSPGLSHKDSFFAQVHMEKDPITKELRPSRGRKYIGIASHFIGIQQLQVKVYTTVLQIVKQFDNPDAYWTLLAFYNSIRELGGSLTLFQTDMSNYFLQFRNKHYIKEQGRFINTIKELTSRLENRQVTNALNELKTPFDQPKAIDVCLASNIIEVGVDVERLSLMSIVGQPKNTAQYIQVSGRVGRAWFERPGLVMTLYKLSMSRDKSHFEHFKEYHQSLYQHVEATSVTPFSEPSIDRALAGIMIGWLRQLGDEALGESPITIKQFTHLFDNMYSKIRNRLINIDSSSSSLNYFEEKFEEIKNRLLSDSCTLWQQNYKSNDYFYMYSFGSYVPNSYKKNALPILTSLRNVDASCMGTISNIYNSQDLEVINHD